MHAAIKWLDLCASTKHLRRLRLIFLQVSKPSSSSSQSLSQMSDSNSVSSMVCSCSSDGDSFIVYSCSSDRDSGTNVVLQSKQCQTQLSLRPSNGENELLALSGSFSQLMLKKKISIAEDNLLHSASAMIQLCHNRSTI